MALAQIGICTAGPWLSNHNDDDLKRDIDGMAATGFEWVRWGWPWSTLEREKGVYGPATLDRWSMLARYIRDAGMQSLPVLGYTAQHYWQPALAQYKTMAPPAPQHYDEWGRYVERCVLMGNAAGVKRYAHWNESNHDPFWKYPSVKVQADMMRQSIAGAKRADPEARFVLGEFAPGKTRKDSQGRELGINMVEYVDRWYKAGYKSLQQGHWSIHPYMGGDPDERQPWSTMTTQYDAIRAILVANGHGTRKIWGTEFGYTTQPNDAGGRKEYSEAQQADLLVKQCDRWRHKAGAGPGFVFNWQEFGDHDGSGVNGLGIQRLDGSFKPARAALRELLT